MRRKIGFMGLGIMGAAMAANVRRAGYHLMVYSRTPGKGDKLTELGAGVASSPKALAQAPTSNPLIKFVRCQLTLLT